MQVSVTSAEGLKRTLKVVIGQGELGERFTTRLGEVKDQIQLKGFRKGKVPPAHIKKVYGRSLMAQVLQKAVEESTSKAIAERKERPAFEPRVEFPEDGAEVDKVIDGKSDLTYSVSFEVLPEIKVEELTGLALEKLVADVPDDDVTKALESIAERNVSYAADAARAAETGDQVTMDFVGRVDGVEFEGGKGEEMPLVLGSGQFIPGFEEQLTGVKAGEERVVKVTFPAEYPVETLKGKEAEFTVTAKAVGAPQKPAIDDELAKGLGVESLDELKKRIGEQIKGEYEQVSRAKLKRQMLDELDKTYSFELPPTLVESEFQGIWGDLTRRMEEAKRTFADEGKSEDDVKAEYRKLAERRVRLGLVLGEIGTEAKVEVTQDELRNALFAQARRFPGQEKMVYEYFQKNPSAITQLRAPIYEDKVVDYITTKAKVTERKVAKDELLAPMPDGDGVLDVPAATETGA